MSSLLWQCLHLLTLRISAAGNYTLFRTHFNVSLCSAPESSTEENDAFFSPPERSIRAVACNSAIAAGLRLSFSLSRRDFRYHYCILTIGLTRSSE